MILIMNSGIYIVLCGLFLLFGLIPLLRFVFFIVLDHFNPRFHSVEMNDTTRYQDILDHHASETKIRKESSFHPKIMTLDEIEEIVNKIDFKNYE